MREEALISARDAKSDMLIFLHGEDAFRSRQKLNEIINQYKQTNKTGLNLVVFDCPAADFSDFLREIHSASLFEQKKLIILKNIFFAPNFEKNLLDCKENLTKTGGKNIVFYEAGKADERKSIFKFLKENAKSQEFKLLSLALLKKWAQKEFESLGSRIESEALGKLIFYCNGDSWRLSGEIKKLAVFKIKEKGSVVGAKDVELMVKPEIATDIFKTIDSISSKNKKTALSLIHKHLERGENPIYLLSMINFQFRNILIVKNLIEKGVQFQLIAKTAGLHPFVSQKSCGLAQGFSSLELKKIYQKIFQADLDVKTGKADPEAVLDLLVAGI